MYLEIKIPVTRAIKQFLIFKYGEVFKVNKTDWLGIIITSILNKKRSYNYYKPESSKYLVTDDYYTISLSQSAFDKEGILIEDEHLRLISRALEKLFREHLFEQAILCRKLYQLNYKDTIINILEFYGIQDTDGYYDAIHRDFMRKKKNIIEKMNKKHSKIAHGNGY
ncbi:hypothetical protein [Riemerella anatipestifer]|uniref:Uncharacterized protein n=1 Tax=Riemerella anatipestifer TaxID=34085 RepID=A0A1S7DU76_RIEAN|nr:hypothetical protein [Riemerella anatipestifer]AQY22664.1 hypothetical protein AB406_1721 [Riemerella anatipestifer]MCO4304733.1 hypothetical protein [Riemerella anatipestifer]MCQ4038878.1 hypothetical protein [Riemerella anatipestifer]MCT6761682.1 hypothetical protein [Riemerella anatipestifer]MCT6764340.1 hypothetical protein [Riemerella anatipestifer]